jgi:hypothetical protein
MEGIASSTEPGPEWRLDLPRAVLLAALLGALVLISRYNYLLFHALAEMFAIVVAFCVFTIGWTSRRYISNAYLLFLSVAYLPVGFLDLLHTLAYQGMGVFREQTFQANQLWIAARLMESLALVSGFAFLAAARLPSPYVLLAGNGLVTAAVAASIFGWKVFPACFVEPGGQTAFKIAAEYVVIAILGGGLLLLRRNRDRFDPSVRRAVAASIVLAMASEFCFTLYATNFGASNVAGHLLKILSFVAIWRALVHTSVEHPYELVFRELTVANDRLVEEIGAHERTEKEKDRAIADLTEAMEEIRTLQGILPICAHCKKIRDDRGAWNQIEAYLHAHAGARFSHGLCPDCLRTHYPEVAEHGEKDDGTAGR